jgi:ABC-type transport system involved in multi-copper enzyme maturation permease subunit
LIKAELRKVFTTQVWFWMLLVCLGLTVLGVVLPIASSDNADVEVHLHDLFSIVAESPAYVALFVMGVLSVTTEYRYQTITPTVLTTPSRRRLITAKLISTMLIGVAYALACIVLELAIALPWLSARGINAHLNDQVGAILGVFVVLALFSLVGLGIGALLKNQIVAVSVGVAFVLILDHVIVAIPKVKNVYPYLLSGGTDAITNGHTDRYVNDVHLFAPLGGVVVLVVWGLVTAIAGASITMNRDIT